MGEEGYINSERPKEGAYKIALFIVLVILLIIALYYLISYTIYQGKIEKAEVAYTSTLLTSMKCLSLCPYEEYSQWEVRYDNITQYINPGCRDFCASNMIAESNKIYEKIKSEKIKSEIQKRLNVHEITYLIHYCYFTLLTNTSNIYYHNNELEWNGSSYSRSQDYIVFTRQDCINLIDEKSILKMYLHIH
jgi:hypothetical protein